MHALVVETVMALAAGGLAEAGEIFRAGTVGDVMLAGRGVQLGDVQARQKLLR